MKDFTLPPDHLLVLLRPDSTFDERKAASVAFGKECWLKGWDDCDEEYRDALRIAGLVFNLEKPVARA